MKSEFNICWTAEDETHVSVVPGLINRRNATLSAGWKLRSKTHRAHASIYYPNLTSSPDHLVDFSQVDLHLSWYARAVFRLPMDFEETNSFALCPVATKTLQEIPSALFSAFLRSQINNERRHYLYPSMHRHCNAPGWGHWKTYSWRSRSKRPARSCHDELLGEKWNESFE